ncbi:hypothetical protein [Streptomyces sp. NPDC048521]|uniref:hypothetical protein n=1 Tax=Streptomyces sp. NPDC048521 TaxID=3365566 RepID=UPI00371B1E8B
MSDRDRHDHDHSRRHEEATDAEPAPAQPFAYPYPERRAEVRRRVSEAAAVADTPPGIPGGFGTTGSAHPPVRSGRDTASGTGAAEPDGDDGGR